ncbi:MAG: glycosyltransferase [Colwellia sp.]
MLNKLSVVIVNYKSVSLINDIERYLADFGIAIIVVDNSDDFSSVSKFTKVIRGNGNIGFGLACNLGADFVRSELVLFLNPDAIIDKNTLCDLITLSLSEPDSILGPVVGSNRSEYSILQPLNKYGVNFIRRKINLNDLDHPHLKVSFISGACMLIHKDRFSLLGGFCKDIFMYAEDVDLCIRNNELGGNNKLVTNLFVEHIGGLSSNKSSLLGKFRRYKNSVYGHYTFFRKNNGCIRSAFNSLYLASGIKL